MSQQPLIASKSLRIAMVLLLCFFTFFQAIPSSGESRLCNPDERQARLQLLNQLRGADETYEGTRTNYLALKSVFPEEQAKLVPIQKKFEANESKYSALLKEIKKLEPGYIKAVQRWNSYNGKILPSVSRFNGLIEEFNRLIIEFKKQQDIKEYQVSIALKYGDANRAEKIRMDIRSIAEDIRISNENIYELTRSRNSIYLTVTYKMEAKAFNSVAGVYASKKAKLDSLKAIRQQYFSARNSLRQIELQVVNGLNNLRIMNSERNQLYATWMRMDSICQLEVVP